MSYIKVAANKFIGLVMIILFSACAPKTLSPEKYIKWVEDEDNGLSMTKEFDNVTFQVLYKPANYVVAKELMNGGIKNTDVQKRLTALGDMQYVTLRIKSNNSNELLSAEIKEEAEYNQRLEYFMGYIQNDIKLIEGTDTLPCALSHFERSYGLAPYNNFILAFPKTKQADADKTFLFDDRILGTGRVMMNVRSEDIKKQPGVTWN